jgi:UDP-N-acetylmuramoyl-L-alanyl-D-glutamate--2,6-diaminopimelate ligase
MKRKDTVRLDQLLIEAASRSIDISGVACDSRRVKKGDVFVAISGAHQEGSVYATAAAKAGAVAIIGAIPRPHELATDIPYIRVKDPRVTLAHMAAKFYAGQPKTVVAITGTSGKSSVADFTRQIFAGCGHEAACLGTLGVTTSQGIEYGALTTPDAITLHQALQTLQQQGISHLAMEASSHGLDQHRLDGVKLSVGAFLNLGRDHLDYHRTTSAYFAAKMRLFDLVFPGHPAVINLDGDRAYDAIKYARARGLHVITVGRQGETVHLVHSRREGFAQKLLVEVYGRRYDLILPLIGDFQTQNALMAAGIAIAVGENPDHIMPILSHLQGVKGRLEQVANVNGAMVVVDYAHKPEALSAVLDTLRPYTTGRLICVLGCGGDRDAGKRPIMGRIAAQKADLVIITDDNPRTEDAGSIRIDILKGIKGAKRKVREIANREEAIHAAIKELQSGDVLVVAGKGHETGQIIGDITLPFSDHAVVEEAVKHYFPETKDAAA